MLSSTQNQIEVQATVNNQQVALFCLQNPAGFAIERLNDQLKIRADEIIALRKNRENEIEKYNELWCNLFSSGCCILALLCSPCIISANNSRQMDIENKIKQLSFSIEEENHIEALLATLTVCKDNSQTEQPYTLFGLFTPGIKKSPGQQIVITIHDFLKSSNIVKLRPFLVTLMTQIASIHQISPLNDPLPISAGINLIQ